MELLGHIHEDMFLKMYWFNIKLDNIIKYHILNHDTYNDTFKELNPLINMAL